MESVRSIEPSVLELPGDRLMSRWTYVIGAKAVAQWACRAASRMALHFMEKAPGTWKQTMESYFLKPFSASLE